MWRTFRLEWWLFIALSLACCIVPRASWAQAPTPTIPSALEPWVGWVVEGSPDIVCPTVDGLRVCAWPAAIGVAADASGALFQLEVYADRPTTFALPGNRDRWPQQVRLDGQAATVLAASDVPSVRVGAGQHVITGRFPWSAMPEFIAIPTNIGRVALTIAGVTVRPRVDNEGRLWLTDGGGNERTETESLRVSVYRKIEDGVPVRVTTWLRLYVSGRAREVELGPVLLAGAVPTRVDTSLPAQVAADGSAKVFVRTGTHDVKIDAVHATPVHELKVPAARADLFDGQETWVWVPSEADRSVELSGLAGVDPERTSLPEEWRGFTAFVAEPDSTLTLTETRRGVVETQPNALKLWRSLWLDLDQQGYTVRDEITGKLNEGWRLDYRSSGEDVQLGRVSAAGDSMLITTNPTTGLAGVELRDVNVDIEAEVRIENALTHLDIVGWDHDVQHLAVSLHLPPGWTLLGGTGVDTMEGTWLASWTLWDLLFVLITSVILGHLLGWKWGVIAFLALSVIHGEPGAPRWVWIHLLWSLALLRVIGTTPWRSVVVVLRAGALVVLVVIAAPFIHRQFLVAFNPQVDQPVTKNYGQRSSASLAKPSRDIAYEVLGSKFAAEPESRPAAPSPPSPPSLQQIDPNAVVQTGPGIPTWSWNTWHLEWTGPVGKDHVVKLWLLTPGINTVLALLRIVLLLFLGLLLIAPGDMYIQVRRPAPEWWRTLFSGGAAALLLFGTLAVAAPRDARAQEIPSPEMLGQLRDRIDASTRCDAPCVVASTASLVARGVNLEVTAEVSAAGDSAWTVPGPADLFHVTEVLVDGRATRQLRRVDNFVQVRLPAGNHNVVVRGVLQDRNSVTLQFDVVSRPRFVAFDAQGWTVEGINPHGVPDSSLQLTRTEVEERQTDEEEEQHELPPWFSIARTIELGMPWKATTQVTRTTSSRPQLVRVPMLPGEQLITDGVRVEGREALVDFARGQDSVEFVSELPMTESLKLVAPTGKPWTESWIVECSRIWNCTFDGVPPVAMTNGSTWRPTWRPWPGEALDVVVGKPLGTTGNAKTVIAVTYEVTPGRLMGAELTFNIRASQGGWQEVTLPTDASLQLVKINDVERTIRPQNGVVRLPVTAGHTTYVLQWHQSGGQNSWVHQVPAVNIGSDAVNLQTNIRLPDNRWLLTVMHGDMLWGPAVLFWWSLLLTLMFAVLLGLLPHVPLKWWEWGLIALGTAQLGALALLPIVAWFVLVSWRARHPLAEPAIFNLAQVGIVFLTFAALVTMYAAVHTNLVLDVDMQVDGNHSTNTMLKWYADHVGPDLPTPAVVSAPLLVYRGISFLWALWAALMIVRVAKWGWSGFSTGGRWRSLLRRSPPTDGKPGPPPAPQHPVERNARDGVLVRVEHTLGGGESKRAAASSDADEVGEVDEPDSEAAREDEIPALEGVDGGLGNITTDDVIGALLGEEE